MAVQDSLPLISKMEKEPERTWAEGGENVGTRSGVSQAGNQDALDESLKIRLVGEGRSRAPPAKPWANQNPSGSALHIQRPANHWVWEYSLILFRILHGVPSGGGVFYFYNRCRDWLQSGHSGLCLIGI